MADITTFSEISGYVSIACWLGAQFPQVLKNIQLQSSEGLALPFLANWLAGDVSNLIGCILTHQLPFQTWLAIYFCFVDMALLSQYAYYRSRKPSTIPIYGHARKRATSTAGRRVSSERHVPRYRTLSTVAANVAAGAALAAQQDGQDAPYPRTRWQRGSVDQLPEASGSRVSREAAENEDEVDDAALAALADSFHSEGGWSSKQKRVSWSSERYGRSGSVGRSQMGPTSPMHSSLQITASHSRGRALQREGDVSNEDEPDQGRTVSAHRASSRASRRGAGMVFLGVWALFGIGTLAGNRHTFPFDSVTRVGKVLKDDSISMTHIITIPAVAADTALVESTSIPVVFDSDHDFPSDGTSRERVLGRIFAWLCTTLYLTSRLPQIWKNFVRKSVEGLSMYLFIFAFLGNAFYVVSILTAPGMRLPPPAREAFIRESIPYLLGSGGTLLFDLTIVNQSLIYRHRPSRHAGRRYSIRSRTVEEEEAALLSADALAGESRTSST